MTADGSNQFGGGSAIDECVTRIEEAYERLGHRLGWRFLNGPAATLDPATQLAFVGLNPGGSRYEPSHRSVEAGLAYRVERWGPKGSLNPLQVQVQRLYEALARSLGTDRVKLMDATLAWNFCPFRSPSWESLANRAGSIAFSRELATDILDIAVPRVIMCLGDVASKEIRWVLEHHGHRLRSHESPRAGWGTITYDMTVYGRGADNTLVIRLPHLSRFGIFGRPQSREATVHLVGSVSSALSSVARS